MNRKIRLNETEFNNLIKDAVVKTMKSVLNEGIGYATMYYSTKDSNGNSVEVYRNEEGFYVLYKSKATTLPDFKTALEYADRIASRN